MSLCECGCGTQIPTRDKWGHKPRFVKGHHLKLRKGEKHHNWKGGRRFDTFGYIIIYKPDHPFCDKKGYVREHRLIMEKHLDRYLTPEEEIHHINKIKDDNRIENLLLTNRKEHARIEMIGNTRGFKKIDTSGRVCSHPTCTNPYKTFVRKNGVKDWTSDKKGGWICSKCRTKLYKLKKKKILLKHRP